MRGKVQTFGSPKLESAYNVIQDMWLKSEYREVL